MSIPTQSGRQSSRTGVIDFGCIGQGWSLFKTQSGVWMGAMLLCFLLNAAIYVLLSLPFGVFAALQTVYAALITHTQLPPSSASGQNPYREFLQTQLFSILLAGISGVFIGGLYRMALQQRRGEPISVFGLFSALPQSLPLFIVGAVVPVVLGLGEGVAVWALHRLMGPDGAIAAVNRVEWVFVLMLNGLLMFAPLLIVDAGANAGEAIAGSMRLLRGQMRRGVWFYVAASFVGGIGFLLCGVGMLATYPVFLISIVLAYLALTPPAADAPPFDPAPAGVWPPPPRVL